MIYECSADQLTDADVPAIGRVLELNTALKHMDLKGSQVSVEGGRQLWAMARKSKNLLSINGLPVTSEA